ncbi:MAG: hypothetical protein ACREBC_13325 [Pyrinomonadaceae bacterium]
MNELDRYSYPVRRAERKEVERLLQQAGIASTRIAGREQVARDIMTGLRRLDDARHLLAGGNPLLNELMAKTEVEFWSESSRDMACMYNRYRTR